jgi:hypothetical protein
MVKMRNKDKLDFINQIVEETKKQSFNSWIKLRDDNKDGVLTINLIKMTELEKYEKVNKSDSLKDLANVIRSFANDGFIQGRTRTFNSELMAKRCEEYDLSKHNNLTREFGIRQQALMLLFYGSDY